MRTFPCVLSRAHKGIAPPRAVWESVRDLPLTTLLGERVLEWNLWSPTRIEFIERRPMCPRVERDIWGDLADDPNLNLLGRVMPQQLALQLQRDGGV